jgi:hypothetical protein
MMKLRHTIMAAFAGALILSAPGSGRAEPLAIPPAIAGAVAGDVHVMPVQQREIIRRRGVGGQGRYVGPGRAVPGREIRRNVFVPDRRYSGRRYAYDRDRYGPRYRYARPGYRYHRDGYYYSSPWWGAGAGLAVGALVGSAIANSAANSGDGHVAWCSQRYRTYDPGSDTFMSNSGVRKRCVGP